MALVYLIILNWKRKEDTVNCLKSVDKLDYPAKDLRILVVDNASQDGSVEAISGFKSKFKIDIIENKQNLGFAGGNNIGIRKALIDGAKYVMLLNNDTEVDKSLVVSLVKEAEKKPDGGAFSPLIYFYKGFEFHKELYSKRDLGKVIWSAGGVIDWPNVFGVNRGVDDVDRGQYNKTEEIEFATGACVLYRSKTLRQTRGFDDRYFMYFEDLDLSVRIKKRGWKIYFVPEAKLWHKVSQSSGIGGNLNDYFITRNRLLFGMKHASYKTRIALIRQSINQLVNGRMWQRTGIFDYLIQNLWKGSWR